MLSLICVWINGWINNREAGDLRRYRAHYDVIVMCFGGCGKTPFMMPMSLLFASLPMWWRKCCSIIHILPYMRPSTKECIADNSIIGYHGEKCCINVLLSLTVVIESKEWLQTHILTTCVGRARGWTFYYQKCKIKLDLWHGFVIQCTYMSYTWTWFIEIASEVRHGWIITSTLSNNHYYLSMS